ncbi:hypothetical protein GE09DRAFT_86640 [Coniochaeta sp. 2T2.1]|nr:hypothetical protein GE09DRAFT_86640 [Coniochaeta sp. 2T2.1]
MAMLLGFFLLTRCPLSNGLVVMTTELQRCYGTASVGMEEQAVVMRAVACSKKVSSGSISHLRNSRCRLMRLHEDNHHHAWRGDVQGVPGPTLPGSSCQPVTVDIVLRYEVITHLSINCTIP